jgi:hypothetical protein
MVEVWTVIGPTLPVRSRIGTGGEIAIWQSEDAAERGR